MFDAPCTVSVRPGTLVLMAACGVLGFCADSAWAQPQYTDLSVLSGPQGPYNIGRVAAVSADGSAITGEATPTGVTTMRVFRLRATGDIEYLPIMAGYPACVARAINHDGSVIVGESNFFNVENYPRRATRWTNSNPAENLGLVMPSDRGGTPAGVSADGSVVLVNQYPQVGTAYFPYLRQANGTYLPFTDYTHVIVGVGTALSADGSTATGYIRVDFGPSVAYPVAFTPGQPLTYLQFPSGGWSPTPFAINHDGSVIYGSGRGTDGYQHLVRWAGGTITNDSPITWSIRLVNDAGTIFAGLYSPDPNKPATRACFSSPTRGFADLTDLVTQLGVNLDGWTLTVITGMSDDGTVMAGSATKNSVTHAWVMRNFQPDFCPADLNHDGFVDLSDFFAFFNCFDVSAPCADLDGNSVVDLEDFFAFFNAFDRSC